MTFELGDRFETHPSAKAELFRLHRGVLQSGSQALDTGVLEPSSVREGSTDGAGSSVINLSTESGEPQALFGTRTTFSAQFVQLA